MSNVRNHLLSVIERVTAAVQPEPALQPFLARTGDTVMIAGQPLDLGQGRLFVVAVGKAAESMLAAAQAALGDAIVAAIGVSKVSRLRWSDPFEMLTGNHPVTGSESVVATQHVLHFLQQTRPNDVVLCLISGGTSALLSQPRLPLPAWQALTGSLLACGCTINEFNLVRRHLDRVKGGGLALAAQPGRVISLILSDVVGSELSSIGSGPTVFATTDVAAVKAVLAKYGIEHAVDPVVWQQTQAALNAIPSRSRNDMPPPLNVVIGDVRLATETAGRAAGELGYTTQLLTSHLQGEAREVGRFAAALGRDMPANHFYVLGGETTVTLTGAGVGGRNLEIALAAAIQIEGEPHLTVATFATDGDDGTSGAAGAIVDGTTVANGHRLAMDAESYLRHNDSYTYFQALDNAGYGPYLVQTGPTGTNVNDLLFIINTGS